MTNPTRAYVALIAEGYDSVEEMVADYKAAVTNGDTGTIYWYPIQATDMDQAIAFSKAVFFDNDWSNDGTLWTVFEELDST